MNAEPKGQPRASVSDQLSAIASWLRKYSGRRPSEAAMEVTSYSSHQRRAMFKHLTLLGCIDHVDGKWVAVKGTDEVRKELEAAND